ncbi:MAG: hypothetical protein QNJ29_05085 [Rhizobiaceae bacterium]|nr:hypothetical protein [Rhizobiaceae bacterium]
MDLIDYLVSNIIELPHIVRWPGIFLIVLYLLRAVSHIFRLRLISVVTNILYATIVALLLAQYGNEIAAFMENQWMQLQANKPNESG